MGRRLLLMLALAIVVGFLVRLAPAQDAPPPPDEPAALPPVAEMPPPPETVDGIVMPPPKKDGRKTPPTTGGAGPNAPRPTAQAPAAAGPPGPTMPDGQLGGVPLVPGPPPTPAGTPPGNLVDGSFDPPAGPVKDPAPRPSVPARDAAVEQSQAAVPSTPNSEGTNPLPFATPPPGQPDASAAATESDEFVLPPERLQMGRQSVGLTLEVLGPAALNLNTVATYRIVVRNGGTADATDVIVRDRLPEGLEFESSQPTEQRGPDSILFWRLGTVPGGDDRTIVVKVKPTKVGQLDHGATVTMRAGAKTRTQVYEPRLKVEQQSTSGQVLRGQPVRFNIVVTNVGNGPARDVRVTAQLSPGLRADTAEANTFILDLGDLASGQRAELETLGADTIRGGQQFCKVTATSPDVVAGDPAGASTQTVTVIEPQLTMNFTGPVKRYTNTVATYTITLENPGTATARNVRVLATLPIGGKLRRTPPNARFDPSTRRLRWDPIQLEPSSQSKEKTQLTFDVAMNGPGLYQVTAEAIAELITKKETKVVQTDVAPLADLEIELTEDRRVVDVGEFTRMEIKVTNRGSKDAAHLIISGRLTPNLKLTRTLGNDENNKAIVKPDKPTEFMFPEIPRLAKGETLILGLEVQATNVGNAGCDIYLNHEDDLPHRDYAGFRVTAPTAGP